MKIALIFTLLILSLALANEFTVTVPFSASDVEINQMGNYTSVTVPSLPSIGNIGAPSLPVMNTQIALPRGTKATSIEVVNATYTPIRGNYMVLPVTEPVPLSLMGEVTIDLPRPDETIYGSSETFPALPAKLEDSSMLIGFPVAYVNVYPVRWNPASRTIEVLSNLEIKVTTETADNYSVRHRSIQSENRTRTIVENTVINPEMVEASGATIIPSRDLTYGEYVVICTSAYETSAQNFADWKTRKGVPTSVYTTSWIQTQYSCTDLQQEIRAFLTDCRDEGVEYVLIWGDDNIIAGRDAIISAGGHTEYPPVDLYWSDINDVTPGNDLWNSNGNSIWGEWNIDNIDYHPDMFTGRASVNSQSEATLFLEKVLAYEQVASTDYFESAPIELRVGYTTELLWAADPSHGFPVDVWGSAGAEVISNDVPSSSWEEEKCYNSTGTNSVAITTAMINAGPAHVYHASHGSNTSFSLPGGSYTTSHFMALTNISGGGLPAIWNSISCLIGHLDGSECMGDAWLASPNGGGFGMFNARYGWGSSSPSNGVSEILCQKIYEENWVEGQYNLGAVHSMGRDEMNPGSYEYADWCVKEYNLFGEPELPLWSEDAVQLAAAHPASVNGAATVTVTVTAGGSPVNGARVCLQKGNDWSTAEVYEVENTNSSGVVNIPITPTSTGTMLITVWAQNKISYLGTITVNSTDIENTEVALNIATAISTPYPNPATSSAAIPFSLATAGTASIQVFDLSGRTVAMPANQNFAAGQHTINWNLDSSNGTPVANGFYSVVVTTTDKVMTERIMVLR